MYKITQLKNGARILTVQMPGRDSASLGIWTKVGGRYESEKISGVSHFIEHMVFKGTKNYSMRAIKENIEGRGGMLNAFTSEESTCYFTKILEKHVEEVFDVLADLTVAPLLRKIDMEKERTVVLEEIKMYHDMPSSHVQDLLVEMLWENQPLGRNVAGSLKTVSELSLDELQDFHTAFYQPANILVTASGNVEHERIVALTESRLKRLASRKTAAYQPADSFQSVPKTHFVSKETEQCHWVLGLHGLSRKDPGRFAQGLLHIILGANMSSRLFNEVREKRGLAYSIHTGTAAFLDTGSFTVSAGVDPKKAPLAIQVSLKELRKIAKSGVTAEELRRAKDYYLGQLLIMLEDTLDHMVWAGERFLHLDSFLRSEEIKKEIEKVRGEDVENMARRIFKSEHLNLALIGPVTEKTQKEIKKLFSFENC